MLLIGFGVGSWILDHPRQENQGLGDNNKMIQSGSFSELVTKAVQSSNKCVLALCLWVNCLHDAMELTCFSWITAESWTSFVQDYLPLVGLVLN